VAVQLYKARPPRARTSVCSLALLLLPPSDTANQPRPHHQRQKQRSRGGGYLLVGLWAVERCELLLPAHASLSYASWPLLGRAYGRDILDL
jgi:hypothetical protein